MYPGLDHGNDTTGVIPTLGFRGVDRAVCIQLKYRNIKKQNAMKLARMIPSLLLLAPIL
jgi:hypothetical protein